MFSHTLRAMVTVLLLAAPLPARAQAPQVTNNPFPQPIVANEGVIAVKFVEFAALPDLPGEAQPARMMSLVNETGTRRLFVNDMRGPIYTVSYDGKAVALYLDINAQQWGVRVNSQGSERGFQSMAFHPQFGRPGTRGFGKFYTLTDTANVETKADYTPGGTTRTHDSVLLEWTAKTPAAATYDGGAPRELMRFAQPFPNHNGGHLTFNPLATDGGADFGLLYFGFADGGSGGDPMKMAQNLGSAFGKILRIDPLGSNSTNGKYGIPAANPFAGDGNAATLGEIYAYGVRNAQRLFWDAKTGAMFMSDIGQNIVEEISPVTLGANLGWNDWEGSFGFISRSEVSLANQRGDAKVTFPIVEFDQVDALLQPQSAAIGGMVYRSSTVPQLANLLIFGDNPSGEIFYVNADALPKGGQDPIRRILLNDNGVSKTLLQVIREKNTAQGKTPATRVDLRFGEGPNGQIFLLNKRDGVIRLLVADAGR